MTFTFGIVLQVHTIGKGSGGDYVKIIVPLFLASLLVRALALSFFPETHLGTNAEEAYLGGAHRLVEGKGFGDTAYPVFTPPLYAIFIASGMYLFGNDQIPIKIAQAISDSLTVVVLYVIVVQLFGLKTALLSAIIASVYPLSIYAATYIGTETFFTLFLAVFVLVSINAVRHGHLRYYIGAGLILGLATLTRGTTIYYPLFFFPILAVLTRVSRNMILKYFAFCLSFAVVIFPWSLRNYIVLGDIIPVATAWSAFLQGSSEKFLTIDGKIKEYPQYFKLLKLRGIEAPSNASPATQDRFLLRAALHNYKMRLQNAPFSFLPFMLKKFLRLWYATESGSNHAKILVINMFIYLPAALGVILAWRATNDLAIGLFGGLIIYFVALHWVSLPLFRYMLPIMPYLIAFAASTIVELCDRSRLSNSHAQDNPDKFHVNTAS